MNSHIGEFYIFALECFIEAGLSTSNNPIFFNHSVNETIYFDLNKDISISNYDRLILSQAYNISHLFDLSSDLFDGISNENIGFFSLEINCNKDSRSYAAYDVHYLLHKFLGYDYSIVAISYNDEFMLSFLDFYGLVIQSEWVKKDENIDGFISRIDIGNMSFESSRCFFFDLAYSVACWYFIYDTSIEYASYELFPSNYNTYNQLIGRLDFDRHEVQEIIHTIMNTAEREFGFDFIKLGTTSVDLGAIENELDILKFDLDGEDIDQVESNDMIDTFIEADEDMAYEYDDIEPEIFKDPILMVKWLKMNS